MKLLMFQARRFGFDYPMSTESTEKDIAYAQSHVTMKDATVVFLHAEAEDPLKAARLLAKCAKNIKWMANKRQLGTVALHAFAHLSDSKAPRDFIEGFLATLAGRLRDNGYRVEITPFGHSLEWELRVFPDSIAKVFKSL